MGRNIVKNISKNLNSKYSQTFFDHTKQSDTDPLKNASKKAIRKIGEKIVDKVARVSKTSVKNNSETNEEELLRKRYISPELRQIIFNDLRFKEDNY